jgi:hypothetical protein
LNARLDEELSQKVEYLRLRTKLSVTDVVKRSIERYYEEVHRSVGDTRAILGQSGFLGCAEGEPNLSRDYKQELAKSLGRKA